MLKIAGAVLILVGTCIGAGLLALPVSISPAGFINSLLLLLALWWISLMGALYILEATQWFPRGVNLISMSKKTAGKYGEGLAWLIFLLLCYSLLCAYISGGSDIFQMLLSLATKKFFILNRNVVSLLFVLVFGFVVYSGIHSLDLVNRLFMTIKFVIFFALIFLLIVHVKFDNIVTGTSRYILASVSIAITSFGFSMVVPSLVDYFHGDVKLVRKIVIAGSLVSLFCYTIWAFVILGALPFSGVYGLERILRSGDVSSSLAISIKNLFNLESITEFSRTFISVCMVTSFFGVSISLFDFLADGLQIKKSKLGKLKVFILTFIPPLSIVLLYPSIFMIALSYAGIIVCVLGILLPCTIVYRGRYKLKMSGGYKVFGGKPLIFALVVVGICLLIISAFDSFKIGMHF